MSQPSATAASNSSDLPAVGHTELTRAPVGRQLLFWVTVVIGLAADLISKSVIFAQLGPHNHTDWILDGWVKFRLYTSFNRGALWGMGQGHTWIFATLSIIAFIAILYWLYRRGGFQHGLLTFTVGLISAGTLGNLYDRLGLHGMQVAPGVNEAVRDFLHFRLGTFEWAIFNVADILLVVGSILLVLQSFTAPESADQQSPVTE